MKVFAHRGASGDYPENTILAFDKALALDVYGIELDVHKSKDGHLVVIHDEDIQRTFKGKGLVMDYTLSELKKFNCRKFEFIENLNFAVFASVSWLTEVKFQVLQKLLGKNMVHLS